MPALNVAQKIHLATDNRAPKIAQPFMAHSWLGSIARAEQVPQGTTENVSIKTPQPRRKSGKWLANLCGGKKITKT
jgi:hypothetical protein